MLLAFGAGLLLWSLAEYLIHRFVLHRRKWPFWPEHMKHHKDPLAETGVMLNITIAISIAVTLLTYFVVGVGGLLFSLGAFVGYVAYVSTHEAMHRLGRPRWLTRLHDVHHKGHHANFGVTTPLWDIAFGTYQRGA